MEEGKKKRNGIKQILGQIKEVKRKSYGPHQVFRRKTGDTTSSGNVRPTGAGHHGAAIQV